MGFRLADLSLTNILINVIIARLLRKETNYEYFYVEKSAASHTIGQ